MIGRKRNETVPDYLDFGIYDVYAPLDYMGVIEWISGQWHKVIIFLLAMDHLYDRLKEWNWLGQYVERRIHDRRTHMSLGTFIEDAEALIALEPLLVKFIEDARAAAPQLEADGADLIAKLKEIFHPATVTVTAPPASN